MVQLVRVVVEVNTKGVVPGEVEVVDILVVALVVLYLVLVVLQMVVAVVEALT